VGRPDSPLENRVRRRCILPGCDPLAARPRHRWRSDESSRSSRVRRLLVATPTTSVPHDGGVRGRFQTPVNSLEQSLIGVGTASFALSLESATDRSDRPPSERDSTPARRVLRAPSLVFGLRSGSPVRRASSVPGRASIPCHRRSYDGHLHLGRRIPDDSPGRGPA